MSGAVTVAPDVIDDGAWFRSTRRQRPAPSAGPPTALGTADAARREARVADVAIVAAELATQPGQARRRRARCCCVRCRYDELRRGRAGRDRQRAGDGGPRPSPPATGTPPPARSASVSARSHARPAASTVYSRPGRGTVLAAQSGRQQPEPPAWAGGLARPLDGRDGERGRVRRPAGGRTTAGAASATGSGTARWPRAATAAAISAFHTAPGRRPGADRRAPAPGDVAHPRRGGRGRRARPAAGMLRYAGLGNIAGRIIRRRQQPRAGRRCPGSSAISAARSGSTTIRSAPGALVVMHSDGLTDRWQLDDYPGPARPRAPVVIAATLLRDAGVRRDDACVLGRPGGRTDDRGDRPDAAAADGAAGRARHLRGPPAGP